jgi:hypothetical protein
MIKQTAMKPVKLCGKTCGAIKKEALSQYFSQVARRDNSVTLLVGRRSNFGDGYETELASN